MGWKAYLEHVLAEGMLQKYLKLAIEWWSSNWNPSYKMSLNWSTGWNTDITTVWSMVPALSRAEQRWFQVELNFTTFFIFIWPLVSLFCFASPELHESKWKNKQRTCVYIIILNSETWDSFRVIWHEDSGHGAKGLQYLLEIQQKEEEYLKCIKLQEI